MTTWRSIVLLSITGATVGIAPATNLVATQPAVRFPSAAEAQAGKRVSTDVLERAIQDMVAPEIVGNPVKIRQVAGPVEHWLAVSVSPPYREFPTVILFWFGEDGKWVRVFEALTPGIQAKHVDLIDLHTKGQAFDYVIGEGSRVGPDDILRAVSSSRRRGLATVAHAYFFHVQPGGQTTYFVDRRMAYDVALRLLPEEYKKYPPTECTMFGAPEIRRMDLISKGKRLVLTAETSNGQTWVISWTGTDGQGLLTSKTVEVK